MTENNGQKIFPCFAQFLGCAQPLYPGTKLPSTHPHKAGYRPVWVIPSTYWVNLISRPCSAVEAGNKASTHISWYPPHRMQTTSELRAVLRTVASHFPWPWLHPQKHKQPCWTPALVRTQRAYWTHMDIGINWYISTIHHWNSFFHPPACCLSLFRSYMVVVSWYKLSGMLITSNNCKYSNINNQ